MKQRSFMTAFEAADLSRGRDSPESREAFETIKPSLGHLQADVLAHIRLCGPVTGCTAKEYARHKEKPLHAVSARFTELAQLGLIRKNGLRRDDSAAWVVI